MLTLQDVALLREALRVWAKRAVGLELTDCTVPASVESNWEVNEDDIVALYELLSPEHVRFIVVDGDTNHSINTRLFRRRPKLHPDSRRWQVRTVIG